MLAPVPAFANPAPHTASPLLPTLTTMCSESSELTGGVNRSSGLARVLGERSVLGVRGRDEALGALDGGVGAILSAFMRVDRSFPFPYLLGPSSSEDCSKAGAVRRSNAHGQVVAVSLGGRLASHQPLPRLVALVDDLDRVLLALGLARERKHILGLAVGDFVDTEPLVGCADQAGQVALDVLNIVQAGSERVVDVDDEHLPVGLALVEQGHDAEHLDLLDLADGTDGLANLAHVQRVVVAVGTGLGVLLGGVFPGLGEGAVVPDVAVVGEAVADEAELALFDVYR